MSSVPFLNAKFDRLPRVVFGRHAREVPAFRSLGIAGYYLALVVMVGVSVLRAGSLLVALAVSAACALSFFGWALIRRAVTGRETLVLLEHVWIAEACAAATLHAMGAPILPYLDAVSLGLAFFLASGRLGCLVVGCCHGRPSSVGIVYDASIAEGGLPEHLVGVRLFPVQLLEATGLVAIGLVGLVGLPFAAEGRVFAWFLASYAVFRFGLEGLRGDERPTFLTFSASRWMAIAELAFAVVLVDGAAGARDARMLAAAACLVALLALVLAYRIVADPTRVLLAPAHVAEVRDFVASAERSDAPRLHRTSAGVSVVVSTPRDAPSDRLVSLHVPRGRRDLQAVCALAARAFPGLSPDHTRWIEGGLLVTRVTSRLLADDRPRERALYFRVARDAQRAPEDALAEAAPRAEADLPRATPEQGRQGPSSRSEVDFRRGRFSSASRGFDPEAGGDAQR